MFYLLSMVIGGGLVAVYLILKDRYDERQAATPGYLSAPDQD